MKKIFIILFILCATSGSYAAYQEHYAFNSSDFITIGFAPNKKKTEVELPAVGAPGSVIILYDETCSQDVYKLTVRPPQGVKFFRGGGEKPEVTFKGKCYILRFLKLNEKFYGVIE